jgi:hypothetical protein
MWTELLYNNGLCIVAPQKAKPHTTTAGNRPEF